MFLDLCPRLKHKLICSGRIYLKILLTSLEENFGLGTDLKSNADMGWGTLVKKILLLLGLSQETGEGHPWLWHGGLGQHTHFAGMLSLGGGTPEWAPQGGGLEKSAY